MTTGILHDQNLEKQIEKQMGCMAGFLQLFDRHQILTVKRLYTTKRLPPSPPADSASQSEKSIGSPAFSGELQAHRHHYHNHLHQHPQPNQKEVPAVAARSSPDCAKHASSPGRLSTTPESVNPPDSPVRTPLPLPVFEFKEGTRSAWKLKEAPRLSLDSRAIMDGKGSLYPREIRTNATFFSGNRSANTADAGNEDENERQRRSPSVIARLMGLEALPESVRQPVKKAELRRSASESRVSRDLLQYRHIDENNYQILPPYLHYLNSEGETPSSNNAMGDNAVVGDHRLNTVTTEYCVRNKQNSEPQKGFSVAAAPWKSRQQRKCFFDAHDVFPEPKQSGSLYGEIEKRLKMRGIDEPAKDLETLKQILEALQLKGLLHSKKPIEHQTSHLNFVFDRNEEESPIVIMKPSSIRSATVSINRIETPRRAEPRHSNLRSKAAPIHRKLNLPAGAGIPPPVKPRREGAETDRNVPKERATVTAKISRTVRDRNENISDRSPTSVARRRPSLNDKETTQRRGNDYVEQRRTSPTQSPRTGSRTSRSDQTTITTSGSSPRSRRSLSTAEISPKERISSSLPAEDATSTISESSRSTSSSQIDAELLQGSRMEYYNEGRSLLERCDKLLNSIAEITSTTTTELQPSPVSVLDPSLFYKDDPSSPSPGIKRRIHFKDQTGSDLDDENWSPIISPLQFKSIGDDDESGDCDYIYIFEILQANNIVSEETDVFSLLEQHQCKRSSSNYASSRLHRKLVFDTVTEILYRKKQLPPWKTFSVSTGEPSFRQVWSEFSRMRDKGDDGVLVGDLFEVICGVLRRDMAGGDKAEGWGDWPAETSEAVLDIERLIFKDIVAETIRDVAGIAGKYRRDLGSARRKLVS